MLTAFGSLLSVRIVAPRSRSFLSPRDRPLSALRVGSWRFKDQDDIQRPLVLEVGYLLADAEKVRFTH